MLANRFVKDPHEVVKAGDVVKVKVLEVDIKRQRIALTMKLDAAPPSRNDDARPPRRNDSRAPARTRAPEPQGNGAMADALAQAFKKR
jgi:uncharacterized protein